MGKLFWKKKDRRMCGYGWNDLREALNCLCELRDSVLLSEAENGAMKVAIQCVTEIMNRMLDGKKVMWDGKDR